MMVYPNKSNADKANGKIEMIVKPSFPTTLHQDVAELVRDYFLKIPYVATVLVVNSCSREQTANKEWPKTGSTWVIHDLHCYQKVSLNLRHC